MDNFLWSSACIYNWFLSRHFISKAAEKIFPSNFVSPLTIIPLIIFVVILAYSRLKGKRMKSGNIRKKQQTEVCFHSV